ncbi:LAMI_0E09098g1_1 [Lachancea mirantina]|uniref:LAMI_0E09098g1_1 n=1 Tax=Lachancea mirantina TaxID=1230905 RepID=A0A1G4JNG2_9SACH|nr:LAMI_0E09098g1_1 [Lachancea mirantina]
MDSYSVNKSRKRVVKACDVCRSRKIKCDGNEPCSNCIKYSTECKYVHQAKRRSCNTSRVSNKRILEDLSVRLDTLETLLIQIRDDGVSKEGTDDAAASSLPKIESEEEPPDSSSENENEDEDRDKSGAKGEDLSEATVDGDDSRVGYMGQHVALSLFTKNGLLWLKTKIYRDEQALVSLLKVRHMMCGENIAIFRGVFDNPVADDRLYELLPADANDELMDVFCKRVLPIGRIELDLNLTEMLAKMRANPQSLNLAELFYLKVAMLLAMTYSLHTNVANRSLPRWREIRSKLLLSTVPLYQYTILNIVGDTVRYIEGVVMLCWFTENSPTPQVSYGVLATAIRLAQEIGLHDRQALQAINEPAEILRRQFLWLSLYRFDIHLSMRTGKPRLIHDHDCSSLNDWDFYVQSQLYLWNETPEGDALSDPPRDLKWLDRLDTNLQVLSFLSQEGLELSLRYFGMKLAEYSGRLYRYLLSSKALTQTSGKERLALVRRLNDELDDWHVMFCSAFKTSHDLEALPAKLSLIGVLPKSAGKLCQWNFLCTTPQALKTRFLLLHMEYYLNLLHTNSVLKKNPWQTDKAGDSPQSSTALDRCTFAARQLLELTTLTIDPTEPNQFLLTDALLNYFSGFLNLLCRTLEHPESSREDLELLLRAAQSMTASVQVHNSSFSLKWTSLTVVTLHLLKAAIEHYNASCADKSACLDPMLAIGQIRGLEGILFDQIRQCVEEAGSLAEDNGAAPPRPGRAPVRAPASLGKEFPLAPTQSTLDYWFDQLVKGKELGTATLFSDPGAFNADVVDGSAAAGDLAVAGASTTATATAGPNFMDYLMPELDFDAFLRAESPNGPSVFFGF